MLLSEQLKEKLRNEFMPIKTLKVYTNSVAINSKLNFLKSLDKGRRGCCSMILDFFEARANTDESKDNYMIVYTSQLEIGNTLGFSREYISSCISRMVESPICPFVKVRQGLNKANYYIMQTKKEMVDLLKQIFKAQQDEIKAGNKEKQDKQKKDYKKHNSTFNNFKQRNYEKEYGSFKELEYKLLGWDSD